MRFLVENARLYLYPYECLNHFNISQLPHCQNEIPFRSVRLTLGYIGHRICSDVIIVRHKPPGAFVGSRKTDRYRTYNNVNQSQQPRGSSVCN